MSSDRYTFNGVNANLGFLWCFNKITLGGVIKTPFTADLTHESSWYYLENPGSNSPDPIVLTYDEKLDMPVSYGIGVAYRFSDSLTASMDIYRTEWDDFILTDHMGERYSAITQKPADESKSDPTNQVRIGAEYLFIGQKYVLPLRGGIFYDPAPAEGSPDDFYGFAVGSGIVVNRFMFDAAYQYRFGDNVGSHIMPNWDFSQDVVEHTVYSSVIIHF